jgi:predicted MFS family arabinose efflux permease
VLALICIAIQGFGLAFSSPASALLLQASVPDQALEQAIGGGGLGSELGRFLGAVAGWVLLGGRPVAAVFGNIASLLVLMGAYRSLPTNPRPGRSTTRARQPNCQVSPLSRVVRPVADGHVAQRWVRGALGGIVLVHLLAFPYLGLAPARAAAVVDPDRVSAWAGAMLSVAGLAAALSSAYFAQRVRRDQARSTLAWSSLLAGGALALWGVVDHPYFAVALVAAVAATAQLYLMCCTVLIHTHTRPDARGRVLGLSRALTDVCYAGALAGQGYAVQRFGFGSLAAVGGVFAVAGFLTAMGTRAPGSR